MEFIQDRRVNYHAPSTQCGGIKCTPQQFSQIQQRLEKETPLITRHYSAEQQTAKQTLTTSKNAIEFTYSNFPCHIKMNRDKLALINRLGNCKKGERLTR